MFYWVMSSLKSLSLHPYPPPGHHHLPLICDFLKKHNTVYATPQRTFQSCEYTHVVVQHPLDFYLLHSWAMQSFPSNHLWKLMHAATWRGPRGRESGPGLTAPSELLADSWYQLPAFRVRPLGSRYSGPGSAAPADATRKRRELSSESCPNCKIVSQKVNAVVLKH